MSAEIGGASDPAAPAMMEQGDENWQALFAANEAATDGDIYALVVSGSDIYVAGSFTSIGGIAASHVARWDGKVWNRLGDSATNGVEGNAYALAVSGDTVYVGGEFGNAGGAPASRVARFLKSSGRWSALAEGVSGTAPVYVGSLLLNNGMLYVGGNFTKAGNQAASSVARWSAGTSSWTSMASAGGEQGVDGEVYAMALDANILYIGGNFSRAGNTAAANVASWSTSGGSWAKLGTGLKGYVNALVVWNGALVAGGEFGLDTMDGVNFAYFSQTKSEWDPFAPLLGSPGRYSDTPTPAQVGVVRALAVNGVNIYVAGSFRSVYPVSMSPASLAANFIARWDGTAQNTAFLALASGGGNGTSGPINAIGLSGANVYVGGAFRTAGAVNANRIALWDGKKWAPLGEELFDTHNIYAILVNGGDIYIGRPANSSGQGSIAKWNGKGWTTLGVTAGSVFALALNGDELYVGGHFSSVEGVSAVNVARFTLSTKKWTAFGEGSGVGGGTYSVVQALAVRGEDLYVAGRFQIADTIEASDIAIYNRTAGTWRTLGDGITGEDFNIIFSLAFGANGEVYVGGRFTQAGNVPANNIAKWSNGTWSGLGDGLDGAANTIAVSGDQVYVGGDYTKAGGAPALRLAVFNATTGQWASLDGGISGGPLPNVYALAVNGSNLYAGGLFRMAGGDSVGRIIRWSTSANAWRHLGSGLDNTVRAMAFSNGMLHVVGEFNHAGGKTSPNYAQWSTATDTRTIRNPEKEPAVQLGQNYPNPFNPSTVIRFVTEDEGYTTLRVFDVSGHEVDRLVDGNLSAGEHEVIFDGSKFESGMYLYQLRHGSQVVTKKLLLSK